MLGAKPWEVPLLPYEKQLIAAIGCSEEEYRWFAAEARRRGLTRPAEYAHIPDARMDAATIIAVVSLVIGLASTAVSYFLTPKPKPFSPPNAARRDRQGGGAVAGANITGADRFAPTFGFGTQAELASYGDPIPIVFARYDEQSKTGGILYSPKLVWSRAFSHGTQQSVKLLFVIGEQGIEATQQPKGIAPPDMRGIFLGNGALDAIYSNDFAFYWKRNSTPAGTYRIKGINLRYGTRADDASGDPETNDDVFSCPTAISEIDTGFSSAHSLSNNAEFGCYSAIANGTPYRVPWRVVPILRTKKENGDVNPISTDDKNFVNSRERKKISGNNNGTIANNGIWDLGMSGTGRNYSRRMGIISLNDVTLSDATGTAEYSVVVGDKIKFKISSNKIAKDYYDHRDADTGNIDDSVTVDDINSAVQEQCIAADEALQVGELFMIRRTIWQVKRRRLAVWTPESETDQLITLQCVEIIGSDQIGLVSNKMLTDSVLSDDDGATNNLHANTDFYALMRVALGLARNTRACDVTEIGIRSKVYQRLNGLTNFQSIPTPGSLKGAEINRIQLSAGSNNSFIRRASAFVVYVRPAGLSPTGEEYEWSLIKTNFVIVGSTPSDQYNAIRFKHPDRRQYEYRFVPRNAADMRNTAADTIFWRLSSSPKPEEESDAHIVSGTFSTDYGIFTVSARGKYVQKNDIRFNLEFTSKGEIVSTAASYGVPTSTVINGYLPDIDSSATLASSVEFASWYSNPSNITEGRSGAFRYELFGRADTSPLPVDQRRYLDVRETLPNNQWITIRYTYYKTPLPAGHFSGQSYSWGVDSYQVIASSGGFNIRQEFAIKRTITSGNPFRNTPAGTLTEAGPVLRVIGVIDGGTVSGGRVQGVLYQIFGAATGYSNGNRQSRNVTFGSGSKSVAVVISATAVDVANHSSGQPRIWDPVTITIVPSSGAGTTVNWLSGDLIAKEYTVASGNPFATANTSVGIQLLVLSVEPVNTSVTTIQAGRTFENRSQYADVTYYPGSVEKSNSNSPEHVITYVNEMVANESIPNYDRMSICGLSLKASRNFVNLDQMRVWLSEGTHVRRFHPDDNNVAGPSNLFCDLVYYLLTDNVAGLGGTLRINDSNASDLIRTSDFTKTARFLKTNKLFFNGVIGESINVRQYINEMAPNFLCNFVISDGKFSLVPAVPIDSAGDISVEPVQIKQLFTSGNILEDTFEVEYLSTEERKPFQAVIRYREERKNQLPQERNVVVRWAADDSYVPLESYDLTTFCTNREHAELVGRFFISIRRRVTHTIRFSTAPYGLDLAPGDYIRVATQASPYSSARNGVISATGAITSVTPLSDGQYNILYYKPGSDDVESGTMTVSSNVVTDSTFFDTVFTVVDSSISQNVYLVEQLTLNEDGIVQIVASEFPCDDRLSSLIAQDLIAQNRPRFVFES